jgi:glycosyltransferase involved in cell wall biosynthesis
MTVSYLVTLYNKEEFVADALNSALAERAQTEGEIIVYDDHSTDHSLDIVNKHAAANPGQVRIIRGEENHGVSFAANRLIAAASQPYIRFVDADDMLVPGSTRQLLRLLQRHELGFIYGRYQSRLENPGDQSYAECFTLRDPVDVVLRHLTATPSSSFFVASQLKKIFPLPEWVKRTQDFTIFLRLACLGVAIGGINEIVALLPPVYTADNLSSGAAAAYAEICRTVALEEKIIPLHNLRNANRRYAGRAMKYFRHDGQSQLNIREKFDLWYWRQFARLTTRQTCINRLNKIAELFNRDRHVVKGLRRA